MILHVLEEIVKLTYFLHPFLLPTNVNNLCLNLIITFSIGWYIDYYITTKDGDHWILKANRIDLLNK